MALKPCKECKQEVSTKAKSCPNCGAKNPTISGKDTAKGCLSAIVFFIIIVVILYSCSDDIDDKAKPSTPEATKAEPKPIQNNAITLNDNNTDAILVDAINLYSKNFKLLIQRYSTYKDRDPSVFILWRNNEWLPNYEAETKKFDDILEKNRGYIFNNGLIPVFSSLTNLKIDSLDIMRAIREDDSSYLKKAIVSTKEDLTRIDKVVKARNLDNKLESITE